MFRLPQLHQCDQGMLPSRIFLEVHWKALVRLVFSFRRPTCNWLHSMQPKNSYKDWSKLTGNLTRNADWSFVKDTNLTKGEASQLHWFELWSLFEFCLTHTQKEKLLNYTYLNYARAPSNFTCLAHKGEASQLCSDLNCEHSLNFTCHVHKRNATEVIKSCWGNLNLCTMYLFPPHLYLLCPFLSHPPLISSLCPFKLSL